MLLIKQAVHISRCNEYRLKLKRVESQQNRGEKKSGINAKTGNRKYKSFCRRVARKRVVDYEFYLINRITKTFDQRRWGG